MKNCTIYDVCIIGTGAAGGILAYKLAKQGLNVISLEQGNDIPENYFKKTVSPHDINDNNSYFKHPLYADEHHKASSISSKQFSHFQIQYINGLQNLWNGISVRMNEQDFNGWPIDYAELAHHYKEVEGLITVCGNEDHLAQLPDGTFIPPKPLRPVDKFIMKRINSLNLSPIHIIHNRKSIETRMDKAHHCTSMGGCILGCPVNSMYKFSTRLLPQIKFLKNYELRLNAKVIRVTRKEETPKISHLIYLDTQTLEEHRVYAHIFVLSAGAIESPRLLFNSRDEFFPHGLANHSLLLGTYLQDNPKIELFASLLKFWNFKKNFDIGYGDHLLLVGSTKYDRSQDFNFIGQFDHKKSSIPLDYKEKNYIPKFLRHFFTHLLSNSYISLVLFAPAIPQKSNYLTLSTDKDCYGVNKVDIHYQQSYIEIQMLDSMAHIGKQLLRQCSAVFIKKEISPPGCGIHYAGTCKMSEQPNQGIVDKNLKCHDLDNLYICDGSVIPMLNEKHLTLTIMSLAHRLACHISRIQT